MAGTVYALHSCPLVRRSLVVVVCCVKDLRLRVAYQALLFTLDTVAEMSRDRSSTAQIASRRGLVRCLLYMCADRISVLRHCSPECNTLISDYRPWRYCLDHIGASDAQQLLPFRPNTWCFLALLHNMMKSLTPKWSGVLPNWSIASGGWRRGDAACLSNIRRIVRMCLY